MNEIERLKAEMLDWLEGRRSWMNLGPHDPYTPDVVSVMDAQEVVKRSAAIVALVALESTVEDITVVDPGLIER